MCLVHLLWVLFCRCALVVLLFFEGRRPGWRPGRRLTFFVSPKKVSKERRPDVHALLRRVRCAAQLGRGLAILAALRQTRALFPPKSALLAVPDGRVGAGADGCCCAAASVEPDRNLGSRFALLDACLVDGRRPGLRPGGRLTFFASPKKVSKKRRPDVHALLRRVRCAAQLGRGLAKLAALKQTRSLIRPSLRCSPCPTGGGDREPTAAAAQRRRVVSIGGRGCVAARLGRQCSAQHIEQLPTSAAGSTQTNEFGVTFASSPVPDPDPDPDPACPVGQGRAAQCQGDQAPRLFERSEFSGAPPGASSAGNHKVALTSGRLFFGYFLLAKQKKVARPPGRIPGLRPKTRSRTTRAKRRKKADPGWQSQASKSRPPTALGIRRMPPRPQQGRATPPSLKRVQFQKAGDGFSTSKLFFCPCRVGY